MSVEDIIVIGSGPAAYSAALFASSKTPLLFEGEIIGDVGPGGQLTTTTGVDNYPGFPFGIQGPELMRRMKEQAQEAGVRIVPKTVTEVKRGMKKGLFMIKTGKEEYRTRSLIIATGASARRLYVPGTSSDEFWQRGISACAVCDGFFFKGAVVTVIGGGDTAMEETLYLSKIAKKVYLVHRRNEFRARKDMLEKVRNLGNIEVITPAELVSAHGSGVLEMIKLERNDTGEIFELKTDGLFFAIGHTPNVQFLGRMLELRDNGYLKADERGRTSVAGIFACGDVHDYVYRQAVTAAGSGCVAGKECLKYLESN